MHKIEIVKKDGKKLTYDLTPSAKVAFEAEFKTGWRKRLGELQMESDLWWFAWRLEKDAGKTDPFIRRKTAAVQKITYHY